MRNSSADSCAPSAGAAAASCSCAVAVPVTMVDKKQATQAQNTRSIAVTALFMTASPISFVRRRHAAQTAVRFRYCVDRPSSYGVDAGAQLDLGPMAAPTPNEKRRRLPGAASGRLLQDELDATVGLLLDAIRGRDCRLAFTATGDRDRIGRDAALDQGVA